MSLLTGQVLEQASDKLKTATGLGTALEKSRTHFFRLLVSRVVVGSVQTMQREKSDLVNSL